MYFEDGKAVTGKKKIGGTTYEFDRYGVTAILPKDRRFTLYTVQKGDSFWAIASKYKVNILELVSLNGKNIFSTIQPGMNSKYHRSKSKQEVQIMAKIDHLLLEMQAVMECEFLSDLHLLYENRSATAVSAMMSIPIDRYSLDTWNAAASYITGKTCNCASIADAQKAIAKGKR